jgi:gamma-glutamylcyclotransferase (GGCT)/AIG2-like uncharacterized protein YtfP
MLYFAYCTLLDVHEMHKYCPLARPAGVAQLPGFKVSFATYGPSSSGGGCNLAEATDEKVLGLLYEMSPEALADLDTIAGVDKGYYEKIDVRVRTKHSKEMWAITYVIPDPGGAFRPTADYTRPILEGARALGLPPAYIEKLQDIIMAARQP